MKNSLKIIFSFIILVLVYIAYYQYVKNIAIPTCNDKGVKNFIDNTLKQNLKDFNVTYSFDVSQGYSKDKVDGYREQLCYVTVDLKSKDGKKIDNKRQFSRNNVIILGFRLKSKFIKGLIPKRENSIDFYNIK